MRWCSTSGCRISMVGWSRRGCARVACRRRSWCCRRWIRSMIGSLGWRRARLITWSSRSRLVSCVARLRALLRRAAAQARAGAAALQPPVRLGPLLVDVDGAAASWDGRDLGLTGRELALLDALARNAEVVLGRDRLLDMVWGYDCAPDSRALDVFMTYLRRKLEAVGAPRLVETVRGVGFVLRRPPEPVKPGETPCCMDLVSDLLRVWGLVDPCGGGQLGGSWWLADEPLGVTLVGGVEHMGAGGVELLRLSVVDGGRCHQADPGVPVLVVVPVEERPAVSAGVVDVVEPLGELGPVLERLEVRLRCRGYQLRCTAGCASWSRRGRRAGTRPAWSASDRRDRRAP